METWKKCCELVIMILVVRLSSSNFLWFGFFFDLLAQYLLNEPEAVNFFRRIKNY